MKKILFASMIGLAGLAAPALAADMPGSYGAYSYYERPAQVSRYVEEEVVVGYRYNVPATPYVEPYPLTYNYTGYKPAYRTAVPSVYGGSIATTYPPTITNCPRTCLGY